MNMAEKIQDLYQRYGELEGISIECQKELIAIGISNKVARAEIFLQGAQVTAYQRHGETPILFLSKECQYQQGSPLRGGIPICWPWFGDINKNPIELQQQFSAEFIASSAAHGFVRDSDWELTNIDIVDDSLTAITLKYSVPKDNSFNWPFAADLVYEVKVGEQLTASLTIKNTDKQPFLFSGALHTYFNVDNVDSVSVKGLDKTKYIDALKNWETFHQQGDITFDSECDRIYLLGKGEGNNKTLDNHPIFLQDQSRKITIENTGSQSLVVWNPWVEKAERLSQFADDDYKKMVCVETANAMGDVIHLEPNEEHRLSVAVV